MGSEKKVRRNARASRRSPEVREADALAAGDMTASTLFSATPLGVSAVGMPEGLPLLWPSARGKRLL
jgi:hypothetical protein